MAFITIDQYKNVKQKTLSGIFSPNSLKEVHITTKKTLMQITQPKKTELHKLEHSALIGFFTITAEIHGLGGAHDSTWIDGSSELFTFPKLYSILIANIASLVLPELIYE